MTGRQITDEQRLHLAKTSVELAHLECGHIAEDFANLCGDWTELRAHPDAPGWTQAAADAFWKRLIEKARYLMQCLDDASRFADALCREEDEILCKAIETAAKD